MKPLSPNDMRGFPVSVSAGSAAGGAKSPSPFRCPRPGPLDPTRIRRIDGSFGWIPHAFVRRKIPTTLKPSELLLYFFLCVVADEKGVSFYGEARLEEHLWLDPPLLDRVRRGLMDRGLILFGEGVYQVLPLPAAPRPQTPPAPEVRRLIRSVLDRLDARPLDPE